MIKLENISKTFYEGRNPKNILKSVNFEFEEGKIYIMYGRSGTGKSTLLNLISGIDTPTSGSITIGDMNISRMNEKERTIFRRNNIGFIFQFFNLIPTLNVIENLLLPVELVKNIDNSDINTANELLEKIELFDRAESYPDRLSGGEQQRVAIARALIHNPRIILADEPTGNLDIETGKNIVTLLDNLVRKQNKTMIMATHSRDVIGIADYIIYVKNGNLHINSGELFK